jgi:hypothetical protein
LPSLEFLIAEKLAAVDELAAGQRARAVARASPAEMASWTLKLQEAKAWLASQDDADAPMLALEAQARGATLAVLVSKVIAKAQAYRRAEAAIAGAAGRHRDAVAALQTIGDVAAYDITAGWPLGAL